MLSCRRASQLLSDAMDRRLSLGQRILLRYHLLVCRACNRFRDQLGLIRAAIGMYRDSERHVSESESSIQLSPAARERIQRALEAHL